MKRSILWSARVAAYITSQYSRGILSRITNRKGYLSGNDRQVTQSLNGLFIQASCLKYVIIDFRELHFMEALIYPSYRRRLESMSLIPMDHSIRRGDSKVINQRFLSKEAANNNVAR